MAGDNGNQKAAEVSEAEEEFRPIDPDNPLDKYVVIRWPWTEAEDRWLKR